MYSFDSVALRSWEQGTIKAELVSSVQMRSSWPSQFQESPEKIVDPCLLLSYREAALKYWDWILELWIFPCCLHEIVSDGNFRLGSARLWLSISSFLVFLSLDPERAFCCPAVKSIRIPLNFNWHFSDAFHEYRSITFPLQLQPWAGPRLIPDHRTAPPNSWAGPSLITE